MTLRPGFQVWATFKARFPEAIIITQHDAEYRAFDDAAVVGADVISPNAIDRVISDLTKAGHSVRLIQQLN